MNEETEPIRDGYLVLWDDRATTWDRDDKVLVHSSLPGRAERTTTLFRSVAEADGAIKSTNERLGAVEADAYRVIPWTWLESSVAD